jgi:hypothetical protein
LELADRLEGVLHFYEFTTDDYQRFHERIIMLRLDMLDRADHWHRYLQYFEEARRVEYYHPYAGKTSKWEAYFNHYDGRYWYYHFLRQIDHRYQIVKRKTTKNKPARHRPRSELTEEEIERRIKFIMRLAENC